MKQFGTGNEPFTAPNVDIAKGDPEELIRVTDQSLNTFYQTGKSIVETAGNTLTPADGTNENPAQVGESVVKIAREQIGAYVTTTGTAGVYAATTSPAIGSLADGLRLCVVFNVGASASSTVNVNGLGAKNIKQRKSNGSLEDVTLIANKPYDLVYDGVEFIVVDPNNLTQSELDARYQFKPSITRLFVPSTVLANIPAPFVEYAVLNLTATNCRSITINASLLIANITTSASNVACTVGLKVNGSRLPFGNRYIGSVIPPNGTAQIPTTISDTLIGLDPSLSYEIELFVSKQQAVGPVTILDAFLSLEYSL